MDIGTKIKNARLAAKLTQEQAAEGLGVSRQTMSNWENGKTYPDIISVIKMSDLYDISLDHLLKEEKSMTNYYNYLEESTNVVKSKYLVAKIILIASYLIILAGTVISYWFVFTGPADIMGWQVLFEFMLIPFVGHIISFILGITNLWGKWRWLSILLFGLALMLLHLVTVAMETTVYEGLGMYFLHGIINSATGMGLGALIYFLRTRKRKKALKEELVEA